MNQTSKTSEYDVQQLMAQLTVARTEISNLRQQIKSLNYLHKKECDNLRQSLQQTQTVPCIVCNNRQSQPEEVPSQAQPPQSLTTPYIGTIKTNFPEKRATPRQPGICTDSIAKLTLNTDVFTNPEHSLEGLEEYSHMWLLFHFHKNEAVHVRAKVAPPRLNGLRTGVFATRSPHRPSPIGLSLVKIEQIHERSIFFSGVDMVDGTPVLDLKPFIPQYDNPSYVSNPVVDLNDRLLDGRETDTTLAPSVMSNLSISHDTSGSRSESRIGEREAPDGEEEEAHSSSSGPIMTTVHEVATVATPEVHNIRVPAWINEPPVSSLSVVFSERAIAQLQELQGTNAIERQNIITSILREDPRSVYLRARWGNQYYTFRIAELHVSCKFDDVSHSVTVFQIRTADSVTDE